MAVATALLRRFEDLSKQDVDYAGGKGANLGEMTAAGLPVPPGFVVGASSYALFCDVGGLRDRIEEQLSAVDVDDTAALDIATKEVRKMVEAEPIPDEVASEIRTAYLELAGDRDNPPVAVRSSATAEDTEAASFAGMNETFLNVRGPDEVVDAVRRCWSSLFGARTVFYRAKQGFGQADMDIAVVVQIQILSTRAGVMFTIDPASGDRDHLVIEGSLGLGESVVSGQVSPDRYVVEKESLHILKRDVKRKELVIEPLPDGGTRTRELSGDESTKPVLSDDEVLQVAKLGIRDEEHYGTPQDTEWAFDEEGLAWMLQSRPVTASGGDKSEELAEHEGEAIVRGLGAAPGIGHGEVKIISDLAKGNDLKEGDVLVTHMTAPDWVPLMRRSAAIITDSGGMTCHAAIVSRELGIPCVVGAADATSKLRDGELVTVDATHGSVYEGEVALVGEADDGPAPLGGGAPVTATQLLVNLSEPSQIERATKLDVDGVGLLRAELMVIEALEGRHPRLLIEQEQGRRVRRPDGRGPDEVRRGLLPPADHLPDDRLPLERVQGPRGRRSLRARGVEPDDRLPGRAPLHARARPVPPGAGGDPQGLGRGAHELPRDAALRPHPARAHRLPGHDARRGSARPARVRALGDGGGPLRLLPPGAVRGARRQGHLDRLQRPHPADARAPIATSRTSPSSSTSATPPSPTTCAC